ncbi:unnamed protein product [Danaus chrysippus]|uniref:(African queen) hypothetical protein n=1 Tax=Danaus chrysippus TaxID=151541 RepID=A0A8J2WBD7_9NEOP|nr:unnamed protein product [Danaus chrysippus]
MIQLSSGKRLMMINGYTFHCTGLKRKLGVRWQCSGKNRGCNANYYVNEENDAQLIQLTSGATLLVIDRYSYHKISSSKYGGGYRWRCSSKQKEKCKAFAVVSKEDDAILRVCGHHNHSPPMYNQTPSDTHFINLPNGKVLLMVDGYTFHKGGGHIRCFGGVKWRCSASKKRCNAYVAISDNDEVVIRYSLNHNAHMITTAHGKNWLVYDGYTFYFRYRMRVGQKWVCTNFPRCKAFLCVNDHYDVIDCVIDHSHFKRILQLCPDVQMITTVHGKQYMKYRDHYYTRTPNLENRWRCINTHHCYVSLYVDQYFNIIRQPREHDHQPKLFYRTLNGTYKLAKKRRPRQLNAIPLLTPITFCQVKY